MDRKTLLAQVMVLILLGAVLVQSAGQEASVAAVSRYGSRGGEVRQIQVKLKDWGYYEGQVDGIYGAKTKAAVEYFQQKNGLTVDGVAGQQTLKAIGITQDSENAGENTEKNTGGESSEGGNYNDNDRNLLARVINGEARGEPFEGQVAVGAVILNRVRHPSFPNSIASVVYQPGAFTAIVDGQINAQMYESSYRAADVVLSGMDPSGGAIYYYNPTTATNKWIFSRPVIKQIGKHVFCS